jgi:hypothetical protein
MWASSTFCAFDSFLNIEGKDHTDGLTLSTTERLAIQRGEL